VENIIPYRLFESSSDNITLEDYAWLYMLTYSYGGKMKYKSWYFDTRMGNGTTAETSLRKFDCVKVTDEFFEVIDMDRAKGLVKSEFGADTYADAIRLSIKLDKEQGKVDPLKGYRFNTIPEDIYLRENPKLDIYLDKIHDKFVDHWNSQRSVGKLIDSMARSRGIKEYNFANYLKMFPDEPKTFKIYRGIKDDYDPERNNTGYSCWTTSYEQAQRFSTYHFTGQQQFDPIYAEKGVILVSEASVDDVAVFTNSSEKEVIMKNPVEVLDKLEVNPRRDTEK